MYILTLWRNFSSFISFYNSLCYFSITILEGLICIMQFEVKLSPAFLRVITNFQKINVSSITGILRNAIGQK